MNRVSLLVAFLLLSIVGVSYAAEANKASGVVYEKGTGNPLGGITIYAAEMPDASAISDKDGGFELFLPTPGSYTLFAVGVGYQKPEGVAVVMEEGKQKGPIGFYLAPAAVLEDIMVRAERNPDRTGKTAVSGKAMSHVPGSGGDPLRGIMALPGITATSDGRSEPAIRGSGPHDNFYYIDFLPAGQVFHMGGLVSAINADLVDDFNLYSAAFGPEYANVTGGVIDIKLREPRTDRLGAKVNVSMLEADVLVEGPVNEKQGFYLTARRSYADLFMPKTMGLTGGSHYIQFPNYYDYQLKYLFNFDGGNQLSLQATGGGDRMSLYLSPDAKEAQNDPLLAGDISIDMQAHTTGAVLSNSLGGGVTNRLGIAYYQSGFKTALSQAGNVQVDSATSYMRDQLEWRATEAHEVTLAAEATSTQVKLDLNIRDAIPNDFSPPPLLTTAPLKLHKETIRASSYSFAAKDRWHATDELVLVVGGKESYDGYFKKHYVEPRASVEYTLDPKTLLTAGWGKYHQFPEGPQVIRTFGNPDLDNFKAEHYVLGVERKLPEGWSVKAEGYYKKLSELVVPHQPENYLNGGSGKAYGLELFLKKDQVDDWSGWITISKTKTERHNDITGEDFAFASDQPIIVNAVYSRKIWDNWRFGAKWRYQSGAPFTPVIGTTTDGNGNVIPIYGTLGSERLPDYHRLDIRFDREVLYNTWKMSYYIEIINVYARQNVSGYQYTKDYVDREPVTQMPFFPSFGIQAEF